jgi:hypothetical protein
MTPHSKALTHTTVDNTQPVEEEKKPEAAKSQDTKEMERHATIAEQIRDEFKVGLKFIQPWREEAPVPEAVHQPATRPEEGRGHAHVLHAPDHPRRPV